MALHDPFTLHKRPSFFPPELKFLFWGNFFVEVAHAWLLVIVPITLFQFSQEIIVTHLSPITAGLLGLATYYFLQRLSSLPGNLLAARLLPKLSLPSALAIGSGIAGLAFALFALFDSYPTLFFLSSVAGGVGLPFFWLATQIIRSQLFSLKTSIPGTVGSSEFLQKIVIALAPLLGALTLVNFGVLLPVLIGGMLFALGAVCFLFLPPSLFQKQNIFPKISLTTPTRKSAAQALGIGMFQWERIGSLIFWPAILFIVFQRVEAVAYILSSATLGVLLLLYLTDFPFTLSQKKHLQQPSGLITGILWVTRFFFLAQPVFLFIIEFADRAIKGTYTSLFEQHFFAKLSPQTRNQKILHRELAVAITVSCFLLATILFLLLSISWSWLLLSFALAGLWSGVYFSQSKANNE